MPNKMLIDASHREETRVVVLRGNRIEEFDFESQDKKQLKGNIYLARVTRVEPSLQAAFVEYGGNRHGFLAFSEIHPDYYQIPVADRQALLRAEAEAAQAEDDDEDEEDRNGRGRRRRRGGRNRQQAATGTGDAEADADAAEDADTDTAQAGSDTDDDDAEGADDAGADDDGADDDGDADDGDGEHESAPAIAHEAAGDSVSEELSANGAVEEDNGSNGTNGSNGESGRSGEIESVGAEDAIDEARDRRRPVRRQYKIQEVIKRRQILLVQVVKEERGNKGAALTTYLSLAGRYSVLMPNTARGGGISRKITNAQDRKRLKDVVKDLEVPQGMGVILRTAGESRTRAEIKRDYEYLMRLWENVRTLTLQSTAPALVYEEGSLIKRSVRDLYNKDIGEILVAGEDGYREAKDFMRMLMPSHAKAVQPYRENVPILVKHGVEAQLDRMLQPQVTLKSGGYIIINQTEALVAIDVNSGRSTREHSIEDTALQTNLEAAEEVAHQLRLRDLAGLIVIDFIDMEENRNNRAVEKRLKDCLKNDRARIQVGRISHFGLLEMSRQRIRSSVLESTMQPCPHCGGTGHIRSESSVALLVIRAVEEFLLKENRYNITVRTPASTAFYVLNHKRGNLAELEARFGLSISVEADESVGGQHYAISKGAISEKTAPQTPAPQIEPPALEMDDLDAEADEADTHEDETDTHASDDTDQPRRKRRRRRRRGGRDRDDAHQNEHAYVDEAAQDLDAPASASGGEEDEDEEDAQAAAEIEGSEDGPAKRRRRGKRGGRRSRRDQPEGAEAESVSGEQSPASEESAPAEGASEESASEETPVESASVEEVSAEEPAPAAEAQEPAQPAAEDAAPAKPRRATSRRSRAAVQEAKGDDAEAVAAEEPVTPEPTGEEAEETAKKKAPARKPARPRTTRKKAASEPEQESADAAEAAAEPQSSPQEPEPVAASTEPEAAPQQPEPVADEPAQEEPAAERPRRSGWWQRKSFF